METGTVSKRKRKALVMLPLLVIPFLTLGFWALGGGKGEAGKQRNTSALNLQLPNAKLKETGSENKMSYYDQAEKDSAKWREGAKTDLMYKLEQSVTDTGQSVLENKLSYNPYPTKPGSYRDPSEEKVYQKLAQLNQQLQGSMTKKEEAQSAVKTGAKEKTYPSEEDKSIKRLEEMMQNMSAGSTEVDPEMKDLNQMMEKVLDIQHPERVKDRLKSASQKADTHAFGVEIDKRGATVSLLGTVGKNDTPTGFYGSQTAAKFRESHAIGAVVYETQTLVEGSVIKLRLLQEVTINGIMVAKDNFVFGAVALNGERLQATINSVRYNNHLLSVKLELYDMDGLPGIYIPGAITRDVAKHSADNAAQLLQISSLDPSLKAQATSAGLSAVKTLLSKKTKLVKVTVKAGYKVLLKDLNTINSF